MIINKSDNWENSIDLRAYFTESAKRLALIDISNSGSDLKGKDKNRRSSVRYKVDWKSEECVHFCSAFNVAEGQSFVQFLASSASLLSLSLSQLFLITPYKLIK